MKCAHTIRQYTCSNEKKYAFNFIHELLIHVTYFRQISSEFLLRTGNLNEIKHYRPLAD